MAPPALSRRHLLLGGSAAAFSGCIAPGPDGVADFTQPRQTVVIVLGVSLHRIPDEEFGRRLRLTCHS